METSKAPAGATSGEGSGTGEGPSLAGISDKGFYKIGDVCDLTDTQPYVLRFWESEFPQLAPRKSRSGQRIYQKKDIEMVLRIKRLLYEEEYTIAGARKKLEDEEGGGVAAATAEPVARTSAPAKQAAPAAHAAAARAARPSKEPSSGGDAKRLAETLRTVRSELRSLRDILKPGS